MIIDYCICITTGNLLLSNPVYDLHEIQSRRLLTLEVTIKPLFHYWSTETQWSDSKVTDKVRSKTFSPPNPNGLGMNRQKASVSPIRVNVNYSVFIALMFQMMVLCPTMPAGGCLTAEWPNPQIISSPHVLQRINQVGNSEKTGGSDYHRPFHFPTARNKITITNNVLL